MLVDDRGRQVRIGTYGLAVTDAEGSSILLTRLAPDEIDADFWTLPGGGLDWGEHPLAGLRREFIEETGLEPVPVSLIGIHSFSIASEQRRRPGPPIHVIQAVYLVAAHGDLVHEVGGSTVEARWFPLTEIKSVPVVDLVKVALGFWQDLRSGSTQRQPGG